MSALLRLGASIFSVAVAMTVASTSLADTQWSSLRDAVVYVKKADASPTALSLKWREAWIADSQEERVYFQRPDGALLRRIVITPDQLSGNTSVTTPSLSGVYRVEVPGASFRAYTLGIAGDSVSMIEPVKVHQSMHVENGDSLYVKIPANKSFTLCGKYHDGAGSLSLLSTSSGENYQLALNHYGEDEYSRYDSIAVAARSQARTFRLTFNGTGKVSFWVDGVPNLFAQQPQHLFDLALEAASSTVNIGGNIGDTPLLGAALPYEPLPAFSLPLYTGWKMTGSSYYFMQDSLTRWLDTDVNYLDIYEKQLGIKGAISIMANSGRRALIEDTQTAQTFLHTYLKTRHEQGLLKQTYIAFADEPNLNYSNPEDFESQFVTLATSIRQHKDAAVNSTLIAAPQSSRFWNGPTIEDAVNHRGIDMAERLLASHYDLFDALTWHEWQVRDLIATDWYYDSIIKTYNLMKRYQPSGKAEKKLVIAQTNISSGNALSSYEQETFFASLWWASIVAQSTRTGKLQGLVWFLAADDGIYKKGLVTLGTDSYREKPVSAAMRFVNQHVGTRALASESNHPELDVAASLSASGTMQILGVNKGERVQNITLRLPRIIRSFNFARLDETGSRTSQIVPDSATVTLQVPPKTIFALDELAQTLRPSSPQLIVN